MRDHDAELLTSADASRRTGGILTPEAIRAAARRQQLRPRLVTPGGIRLFAPGDVDEYMRRRAARRGLGVADEGGRTS